MNVFYYPDINDISFKNAENKIEKTAIFNESHDYLKITVIKSESASYSNYVGRNGGGGVGGGFIAGEKVKDAIGDIIFLYMPHQLSETFQQGYNVDSIGMLGAAAIGMLNQRGDTASMAAQLKDAANGLKPEAGLAAMASAVSAVANIAGVGGQVNANTISQLTKGAILNPYKELTYQGTDFRSHSFSFKLTVNTERDIAMIRNILHSLKYAMHPGIAGAGADEFNETSAAAQNAQGTQNQSSAGATPAAAKFNYKDPNISSERWLLIPDFFKLELIRVQPSDNPSEKSTRQISTLVSFPTYCVLENMSINYTPDGSYQPLKGIDGDSKQDRGVLSYQLDLQFRETAMLTKASFGGAKKAQLGGK